MEGVPIYTENTVLHKTDFSCLFKLLLQQLAYILGVTHKFNHAVWGVQQQVDCMFISIPARSPIRST